MTYLIGTPNALGQGNNTLGIFDDDRGALYRASNDWSPRLRGQQTNRGFRFFELWRTTRLSDDLGDMAGMDWDDTSRWGTGNYGDGGARGSYYIKGSVVDVNDTPQTGVLVSAFRTADNVYVASVYSDSNGNYSVPTPYSGSSHFIVAYLDTASDLVGTTVNNLTPSATPWP